MSRHIAWVLAGRMIYAFCLWLVVIAVAQLGSTEMLGRYSYAVALIAPLVMLSRLNLRVFMITDVQNQFSASDYLSTRFACNILVAVIVVLVVWLQNMDPLLASVVLAVMLYKLVESVSDFYHGQMQSHQQIRSFAVSLALHGVVCLAAFTIGLLVFDGLLVGALLTAIGWLLLLYSYDRPQARVVDHTPLRITFTKVPSVVKACLLLGVVMGLLSLRINVPVYFIKAEFGLENLGIYSAAAYFLLIGNLVATSVMEVAVPRIARARAEKGGNEVSRLLLLILALLLLMGAAGILLAIYLGDWIMRVIYGEAFKQSGPLLVLFAVAVTIGFVAQLLGSLLTIVRRFVFQVLANVIGIATIALVCMLTLAQYGLVGAGMAIIAGNLALLAVNGLSVLAFRKSIFSAMPSTAVTEPAG